MSVRDEIWDKGWRRHLGAPVRETENQSARSGYVISAFAELSSLMRPLAIEVEYCYRDEFSCVALEKPEPFLQLFVDERAKGRVPLRSTVAAPPAPTFVADLGPENLRSLLSRDHAAPSGFVFDWCRVETVSVALHSLAARSELTFANLANPIPPFEPGWFAGPVGNVGFENTPPVWLRVSAPYLDIDLDSSVHWPPWCNSDSAEGAAWSRALDALIARGWRA